MDSNPSARIRVFTSAYVLLPGSSEPSPATIEVTLDDGKIKQVHTRQRTRSDYPDLKDDAWIDAGEQWILPGVVDAHVHLNDPGRTDWEGFYTGTLAAASGGVTTVVDMPLNSIPPTTTVENLEIKRKAAEGQCWVDVAFWGGLVPGNDKDLKPMVEAGVRGFKGFMIESGVDEFPRVTDEDIVKAMEELSDTPTTFLFHAELENTHAHTPISSDTESQDPSLYSTFLNSRPPSLEVNAIDRIIHLQQKHASSSLRCHIVHLSAADAVPAVRAAQRSLHPDDNIMPRLTTETCFHYLTLAADQSIPDAQASFKCCPPIRDDANREALWKALIDGTISCVVSDHSPCTVELKRLEDGNLMKAWGGVSGLGLGLSLLWTEARKRGIDTGRIVEWVSAATARHAGLEKRKGAIKVGLDGDLVIFDPEAQFEVTKDTLQFKNKLSAYEGRHLRGRVLQTFLRGHCIWDSSRRSGELSPLGILL